MNYTITRNEAFKSTEITFAGKPSEAIRAALKSLHFRWHSVKKVWYGYKDEATAMAAIAEAEAGKPSNDQKAEKAEKAPKSNKFGVQVGDLFHCSWGWEQTNSDFFQVIALVGESSVRVRQVYPEIAGEQPTGPMAADREYKLTKDILPPAPHSVFIEDQEKGDLKRLRPGYCADPEEANKNCSFKLSSFATAHRCHGETMKTYESWYA